MNRKRNLRQDLLKKDKRNNERSDFNDANFIKDFKRYIVCMEVQIDRDIDPEEMLKSVFTDSHGNQHILRNVLSIEEVRL